MFAPTGDKRPRYESYKLRRAHTHTYTRSRKYQLNYRPIINTGHLTTRLSCVRAGVTIEHVQLRDATKHDDALHSADFTHTSRPCVRAEAYVSLNNYAMLMRGSMADRRFINAKPCAIKPRRHTAARTAYLDTMKNRANREIKRADEKRETRHSSTSRLVEKCPREKDWKRSGGIQRSSFASRIARASIISRGVSA